MMAIGASALQITAARPSVFLTQRSLGATMASFVHESDRILSSKLTSSSHLSSVLNFKRKCTTSRPRFQKFITRSMSEASGSKPVSQLSIDLKGKRAFIAGVADDNGYGWAIAKSLAAAGAEILVGTWVPALNIFEMSLRRGKFDESRVLPDGSLMEITKVYPLDAVFDNPEDVPEDIKANKRYAGASNWTVQEVAESVKQDFGSIDILVHSLANGPEVTKPLLETSRKGYLAAVSASSYSYVSLLKHFLPIMNPGIEWYYNACTTCNKKVVTKCITSETFEGSDQFEEKHIVECPSQGCNEQVVCTIPRFKIPLRVQDKTGVLPLTLFDRDAEIFLKKSAKEIVEKILDDSNPEMDSQSADFHSQEMLSFKWG